MFTIDELRRYGANTAEGLARCMNNESFYLRIVGMSLDDPNFEKLAAAVGKNDKKEAFEAAHALKGVSGNLSLTPLYEKVVEITELLRNHTQMDYSKMLQGILDEKKTLESMINE